MGFLKGVICFLLLVLNTLFWCIFLLSLAVIKLIIPFEASKRIFTYLIILVGEYWIFCNGLWIKIFHDPTWKV